MNIAEFGKSQSWCVTFPWVTETSEDQAQNWKHQIRIYNCTKYICLNYCSHSDTVWLDCWPPVLHRLICCTSILYLSGMCIICHVHLNLQSSCVNRFRDNKATFGKLQFFSHLCKKLHQDMEEFAEILSPSRKGGLNYLIASTGTLIVITTFNTDFSFTFAWSRNYWKGRRLFYVALFECQMCSC